MAVNPNQLVKKEDVNKPVPSKTSAQMIEKDASPVLDEERETRLNLWALSLERHTSALKRDAHYKADFAKQALELENEILQEIGRQKTEAELLSKFQNVEFFTCNSEENANKINSISLLLSEGDAVEIDAEDNAGNTLLDYALKAGNFFIASELILLGARKCKNINLQHGSQNLFGYALDAKTSIVAPLITMGVTFNPAHWDKILKWHKNFNPEQVRTELSKHNEYIQRCLAALELIKNEVEEYRLKRNRKRTGLALQVNEQLKKLYKVAIELREQKSQFTQNLEEMCKKDKIPTETTKALLPFLSQFIDINVKIVLDFYGNCKNVGMISEEQAIDLSLGKEVLSDNEVLLGILWSNQELEHIRQTMLEKREIVKKKMGEKYASQLEGLLLPYRDKANKLLLKIKKLWQPMARDFFLDIQEFFKTPSSDLIEFSEEACEKYLQVILREFHFRKLRLESFIREQGVGLACLNDILELANKLFMNQERGIREGISESLNFPAQDMGSVPCMLHVMKEASSFFSSASEAKFRIMLDMARGGTLEVQKNVVQFFSQNESHDSLPSIKAADRKKQKENTQTKRALNQKLLMQYETEKKAEAAKLEQERLKEKFKKEEHAQLLEALHKLSDDDKGLLIDILKPGSHNDVKITKKKILDLFGSEMIKKIPPFYFEPTAEGSQLCFNKKELSDAPIKKEVIDSFHRQKKKAINEKFFNKLRAKFFEYEITSDALSEIFGFKTNAKNKKK